MVKGDLQGDVVTREFGSDHLYQLRDLLPSRRTCGVYHVNPEEKGFRCQEVP
jgi:hypothetical protein